MRGTEPITFTESVRKESRREVAELSPNPPRFRLVHANAHGETAAFVSRLAVILAADIVNYTRHMADDEARTHARFSTIFRDVIEPGISRHEARIVKNTGDGFLAEFSGAARAVWFAMFVQQAVRVSNACLPRRQRLEFRMGINLGDVIVERHDVFGHCVNVAAR